MRYRDDAEIKDVVDGLGRLIALGIYFMMALIGAVLGG